MEIQLHMFPNGPTIMWEQKETQESEELRSWERFAVRLFGVFFFLLKYPFLKKTLLLFVCCLCSGTCRWQQATVGAPACWNKS